VCSVSPRRARIIARRQEGIDMPAVKCSVDGCSRRLQPAVKVDPRDRDTWIYPECDACGGYVCEEHCSEMGGRVVCDRCRRKAEAPPLLGLGLLPPAEER
jgi:hypothetical protein